MANIALLIVFLAALVIPLLLARFHITRVPTAVAEIIIGMALGPSLLHLVSPNATLNQLSSLGVVVLLFLSGMEIDFDLFKPQNNPGPRKLVRRSLPSSVTRLFSWPVRPLVSY